MTNFEITLNGTKVSHAALNSEYGVFSAIVMCVKRIGEEGESLTLDISGLNSETHERLEWAYRDLVHEDEIVIKVVASPVSDPPSVHTIQQMEKRDLAEKIKTYRRLKKELKEYLDEYGELLS